MKHQERFTGIIEPVPADFDVYWITNRELGNNWRIQRGQSGWVNEIS
jgi:hypothetical protein